jgi:hypothetical protein
VTVSFRTLSRRLAAGDSVILRPSLSSFAARRLRSALRSRRGLSVQLQLTATSAAVTPTTRTERLNATR